jgi:putative transposase
VEFIREHADHREPGGLRWGVEPICRVLTEHGLPVAPSTYYDHLGKAPTVRQQRDEYLLEQIRRVHAANYSVYGARKVWLQLNREGIEVARCTVERLMNAAGLVGAVRGKVKRTTIADPAAERARDLVKRNFAPAAPDRLWVADITYVSTWSGWVYVAFVIDAYARRILGWRCGSSMTTQLVLDALEQAVWTRQRAGVALDSVVAHTDRGSQYVSIRYTERLAEAGIAASVGTVGDSYDNALAETINGLYKTELIKPSRPWRTLDTVEIATAEWVDWSRYAGDIGVSWVGVTGGGGRSGWEVAGVRSCRGSGGGRRGRHGVAAGPSAAGRLSGDGGCSGSSEHGSGGCLRLEGVLRGRR